MIYVAVTLAQCQQGPIEQAIPTNFFQHQEKHAGLLRQHAVPA
jgi:hypothetical protein